MCFADRGAMGEDEMEGGREVDRKIDRLLDTKMHVLTLRSIQKHL
jgi:hypothetical protein